MTQTPNATTFFGCIGDDTYGNILEEKAKEVGVSARYMRTNEKQTGLCAALICGKDRWVLYLLSNVIMRVWLIYFIYVFVMPCETFVTFLSKFEHCVFQSVLCSYGNTGIIQLIIKFLNCCGNTIVVFISDHWLQTCQQLICTRLII